MKIMCVGNPPFSRIPLTKDHPDSKVHVAHMGTTWILSAPGGSHVGPMNLAIRVQSNGKHLYVLTSSLWNTISLTCLGWLFNIQKRAAFSCVSAMSRNHRFLSDTSKLLWNCQMSVRSRISCLTSISKIIFLNPPSSLLFQSYQFWFRCCIRYHVHWVNDKSVQESIVPHTAYLSVCCPRLSILKLTWHFLGASNFSKSEYMSYLWYVFAWYVYNTWSSLWYEIRHALQHCWLVTVVHYNRFALWRHDMDRRYVWYNLHNLQL